MQKRTRIMLLLAAIGLLLSWPLASYLGSRGSMQRDSQLAVLNQAAEALLQSTRQGDLSAARLHMEQLADDYARQAIPLMIPFDGLHAVTQSIQEARQVFSSDSPEMEQLVWHATRVRLAVDALRHMHQPLWRDYHASISHQLQNMLEFSARRDAAALKAEFVRNLRLYATIRPAMSVHVKVDRLRALNESYGALQQELGRSRIDWLAVRDALRSIDEGMKEVFAHEENTGHGHLLHPDSPLMMMLSMALLLTAALVYVGWRKYVGEERGG